MASQNNTGRQFGKQHAVTLVALAALDLLVFTPIDADHDLVAAGFGPAAQPRIGNAIGRLGRIDPGLDLPVERVRVGRALGLGKQRRR